MAVVKQFDRSVGIAPGDQLNSFFAVGFGQVCQEDPTGGSSVQGAHSDGQCVVEGFITTAFTAYGRIYREDGTIYRMALNIKDPEVDQLATELAARLHTNKTDAIRHALNAQLALLQSHAGNREEQLLGVMRTEIWPLLTDRTPITKPEREEILGYDAQTGV